MINESTRLFPIALNNLKSTMQHSLFSTLSLLALFLAAGFATDVRSQSTFDLDPPMQADTNSHQVLMSTDPSALPVFKFATAEINDKGEVVVSTAAAKQKLIAPLPGISFVDAKLDPKGIRVTENVTQNYTVSIPYTETTGEGKTVTRMRTETKTRTVPVTRYRTRNDEEQAEFEEAVDAKTKEDTKNGVQEKPDVEPATT